VAHVARNEESEQWLREHPTAAKPSGQRGRGKQGVNFITSIRNALAEILSCFAAGAE